ncbi:MAG: bifunctional folylpolyglutamate synthase/dihydrofolate synthase [Gemmatimonadales bacterium]
MSFQDACRFLFPRAAGGTKFNLGPTEALLDSLGHPERHFPVVHIGGTNGKGSTVALVASALRAGGRRVGVYTSPHLVSVRERMMVDGAPISEDAFAMWTERLRPVVESTGASFFEATTAIACADFAARGVDVAVVEVGLGGRLDSTNVLQPVVTAVTKIAREHTEYLGEDLAGIAREKAGIAKPGVPFITGEPDDALAAELIREAERRGASPAVRVLGPRAGAAPPHRLGLIGRHQAFNAGVAAGVLDHLPSELRVTPEARRQGFQACRVPGRFDMRGRWIFDVAHNPDGMAALVDTLDLVAPPRPIHVLVSVLGDKDWRSMLQLLAPHVDAVLLTVAPSAPPNRRWEPELVEGEFEVERDFDIALARVQSVSATVLVTGSFHTVGDALDRLPGFRPLG